jgi:hypothetical protein
LINYFGGLFGPFTGQEDKLFKNHRSDLIQVSLVAVGFFTVFCPLTLAFLLVSTFESFSAVSRHRD